jgi:hypothetical protein
MTARARFEDEIVEAIRNSPVLRIRAGGGKHRIIAVWVVVVEGRAFIRSWSLTPGGWYDTFTKEQRGVIKIAGKELPVRAVRTRSERLKVAVDRAYAEKYHTPGSVKYVKDLKRKASRDSTTELLPLA